MNQSGHECGVNKNTNAGMKTVTKCRYENLKVDLEKTVNRYLSSMTKNKEFTKNFEVIFKERPALLMGMMEQLTCQLKDYILCESQNIFDEENFEEKLNILDTILLESKKDKTYEAWRSSGDVENDLKDHTHKTKQLHNEVLKMYLQTLKQKNYELSLTLTENHQENLNKLECLTRTLDSSKTTMSNLVEL